MGLLRHVVDHGFLPWGESIWGKGSCTNFRQATVSLSQLTASEWHTKISGEQDPLECDVCQQHRRSRCRVFQPLSEQSLVSECNLGETLRSDQFKAALYITRCSEPAASYALQRAQHFAAASQAQILWVQAEGYINDVHFAEMTEEENM